MTPEQIPDPVVLERMCKAIALLEAGRNPNPTTRVHKVESTQDRAAICRIDDGSGNFGCLWFKGGRSVLRGFDHESQLSPFHGRRGSLWPGLYDEAPADLLQQAPTVTINGLEAVTFCFWWDNQSWKQSSQATRLQSGEPDVDGSTYLLEPVVSIEGVIGFVSYYYSAEVSPKDVQNLCNGARLSDELLARIAVELSPLELRSLAVAIGYGAVSS